MLGISVDRPEKIKSFAESLGITFPMLADGDKSVSRAYGVLVPIIRLANRTTFVVDKEGVIREVTKGGAAMDPSSALAACSL